MIRHIRDIQARRRGEELDFEAGFTLIELLIVIVVLGILAATVVFALSNVTSTSAISACNSDAKSYEIAASAYQNATTNTANTAASTTASLVPTYLHAAANNTQYVIAMSGDTSPLANGDTFVLPTGASAGNVYVGPNGSTAAHPLVAYDSQANNTGCNNPAV